MEPDQSTNFDIPESREEAAESVEQADQDAVPAEHAGHDDAADAEL